MKKHHWHLILEPNMSAPKTGVYLFAIRNNNHISYECHKMDEGDSFYSAACTSSTDPTDWFVPIAYHFCKEFVDSNGFFELSCVTDNSWHPCICDYQTDGLRMLAFTLKGVLQYAFTEESCVSLERGCLIYSGDYLFSTDCYTDSAEEEDIRQDTRLIAYHYVEFFGEKGHSYWWNEYRKKQSNIQLHVQDSLFTG